MKNLDLISKGIFKIAIALAIVFCSASLFVFSLNFTGKAKAATTIANPSSNNKVENPNYDSIGSIACCSTTHNPSYIYYVYYATNDGLRFGKKYADDF